jgi:hypothetical protein
LGTSTDQVVNQQGELFLQRRGEAAGEGRQQDATVR